VVTDNPVCVRCGSSSSVCACDLAVQCVVQALEKTVTEVHVTNGVDALRELDASGQLAVAVAPEVLNALEMPLVDENYDFFALGLVDGSKEFLISFVHKDFLELGEENVSASDVPVDHMLVKAVLSEGRRANQAKLLSVAYGLLTIVGAYILVAFYQVFGDVEASFVVQTSPSVSVEFRA